MSNSVNLSLDVTKTGIQNPLIKVRQGDGGFETLRTTVTANGEPMDLQGWIITFMGTTAGNHKIVDGNVKIVEAPNGIFDYTPSKAWGMDIGEFEIAYFKFVKGDGSASSANFRVNVIEAVDLTQEEAKNYISVVDTTIATINQHLNDSLANVTKSIADANNNANTVASNVTALGNRVDDYNNKLAAVQVGGRNLLFNSAFLKGFSNWNNENNSWTIDGSTYQGNPIVKSPTTVGGGSRLVQRITNPPAAGSKIMVSFNAKGNDSNSMISVILFNTTEARVSLSSSFSRYTVSFTIPNDFSVPQIYFWNSVNGNNVFLNSIKVEVGNVPTDWTPAPEDAPSNDEQLVHKTGTETIAGDKTFTSPINGQLSGNAATTTKWQTARTLALTGDVTGSVSMDGSGNVSMTTTGANLVHNTGTETIAGDKTFTGNVNVLGTVKAAIKNYEADLWLDTVGYIQRSGNIVTVYLSEQNGTQINNGYVSPQQLPVGYRPMGSRSFMWFRESTLVGEMRIRTDGHFESVGTMISGRRIANFSYITNDDWPA